MAKLFLNALALLLFGTFAMAQESYKIRPGDVLRIEVLEDSSLNRNALVLPDGTIAVPLVGNIRASGQSVSSLQGQITSGLASSFAKEPNVFVTVDTLSTASTGGGHAHYDIFVIGEVNTPGKVSVHRGTSVLQFLAESGGLTAFAATKRIQVRRTNAKTGQTSVFGFNYHAIERGSANVSSIILKDGDVIVVPARRLFE